MTALIDLWRAVDAEARLLGGDPADLRRPVRGVHRTRAAPPHLPASMDGELLIVDPAILDSSVGHEPFVAALRDAGLTPAAVLLAGIAEPGRLEPLGGRLPVLATARGAPDLVAMAEAYLDDERGYVERHATTLRLAAAEAALADPTPAAPAGLVATRLHRGVAVSVDGELRTLNPRPAGVAVAGRFAAVHARMLASSPGRSGVMRRTRDGLWLVEQLVRPGAVVWLFDDLPFARVDVVAAEALAATLRALLRRPPATASPAQARQPPPPPIRAGGDPLDETLLAVARANGRVAPAARALGVHRNTVLYRLRVARAERGVDPRRPADALALLRALDTD